MNHRHLGGEEYEIRVRALADDDAPPIIRLRHVLKALLRHYNFRATSVRDITPALPSAGALPRRLPGRLRNRTRQKQSSGDSKAGQ